KILPLGGFLTKPHDFDDFGAASVDNHQSKNLALDHFLTNFDQSKNLSPAVCSSYCSSSKYINIFNTRARDNESMADANEQKAPTCSFGDWDASAAWQKFDADRLT